MIVTVDTMRDALVAAGLSRETVNNIKGKKNLVAHLDRLGIDLQTLICADAPLSVSETTMTEYDDDDDLNEGVEDDEKIEESQPKRQGKPRKFTSEWNNIILSMLESDELFPNPQDPTQKLPNINGLRRIGNQLYPDISFQGVVDTQVHILNNVPFTTVTYEITYSEVPDKYIDIHAPLPKTTVRATADCWEGNAPSGGFAIYSSAIAETRAESRAWKKILGLNIASYEEISDKNGNDVLISQGAAKTTGEVDMNSPASEFSIKALKSKCEQLNIDIDKFINRKHYLDPVNYPDKQFGSTDEITKSLASTMLKELTGYQNNSQPIPNVLLKE